MALELHTTQIDGVPVVWTPADGPMQAGLVFRVGRADETLARGGLTHLVEHLVLHQVDRADLHLNGMTSPRTTTFYVRGSGEELVAFLAAVCRGLRELPVERIDAERDVLRVEAAGRSPGAVGQLLMYRYGPVGYGLAAYPEFGLNELTADVVRGWVADRFARGNAALWISGGPPPQTLRLDLPDGRRHPLPEATSAVPRLPAYFSWPARGAAFDAIVERGAPARLYTAVLGRRLHARLRQNLGLSYETHAGYEPRDARYAQITALADTLRERAADLTRELVNLLIDLAQTEVPAEELESVRGSLRQSMTNPSFAPARVAEAVDGLLIGRPVTGVDEHLARLSSVTGADIAVIGRQALDTALALVPQGQAVGRAGFVAAPTGSAEAVAGRMFTPIGASYGRRHLKIAHDGISIVEGLSIATVRYAECVGMLAWPDGARLLYAPDAVVVRVEPQLWSMPPYIIGEIDAAIPRERVVYLPARDPQQIPRPPEPAATPAPTATPTPAATRRSVLRRLGFRRPTTPEAMFAILGVWMVAGAAFSDTHRPAPAIIGAALLAGIWLRQRRRR